MHRRLVPLAVALGALGLAPTASWRVEAGVRHPDPAQVVPLDQIAPAYREGVAEVIRDHTLYRQGKADTFPSNPRTYLSLLHQPVLTLALWNDLSPSPARLQTIGPSRFQGSDGAGASATWQFVLSTPRLHVLLCDLTYITPRGNARLDGRIVMIVRSAFFQEKSGDYWVKHSLEAYVKIDSRGWKAVAATLRPLIERVLEDQIQEAGWFVSLMARLVETYPDWATGIATRQAQLPQDVRDGFREIVSQTRRKDVSTGRPTMADNANASTVKR